MTSQGGNGWLVVGIVALLASLIHNSQETILTLRIAGFVINIVKQEHEEHDT
jgi:hypothetical protein